MEFSALSVAVLLCGVESSNDPLRQRLTSITPHKWQTTFRTGLPPRVVNDEAHKAASRTQSSLWDTFTRRSVRQRVLLSRVPLGPLTWHHELRPQSPGLFAGFRAVGSEEAHLTVLIFVRRSNCTYSSAPKQY